MTKPDIDTLRATIPASAVGVTLKVSDKALKQLERIHQEYIDSYLRDLDLLDTLQDLPH